PPPTLFRSVVGGRLQKIVLEEPERAVIGFAEPLAGLDDFVENRLDSRTSGHGAEDAADCALLLPEILELTSLVLGVMGHAISLSRRALTSNSQGTPRARSDAAGFLAPSHKSERRSTRCPSNWQPRARSRTLRRTRWSARCSRSSASSPVRTKC